MLQEGAQATRRGAGRRGTFHTDPQFPGLCQHQTLGAHLLWWQAVCAVIQGWFPLSGKERLVQPVSSSHFPVFPE